MRWAVTLGVLAAVLGCWGDTSKPGAAETPRLAYAHGGSIWAINADGTERRQLTPPGRDTSPAWSRDGRQLAFVRREGKRTDRGALYTMAAAGGRPRKLVKETCWSPLWSPVKDELAYVRSEQPGEQPGTYLAFVDSQGRATRKPVFHCSALEIHGPLTKELCDWSRDGTRLSTQLEVYLGVAVEGIRLTETGFERLNLTRLARKNGYLYGELFHAWCPTGPGRDLLARCVMSSDPKFEWDLELSVGRVGDLDRVPVVQFSSNELLPSLRTSWSPDGGEIAYEHDGKIFITSVHKPKPRLLIRGTHPRWRPR